MAITPTILSQTDTLLKQCKTIVANLPPSSYLGAGVRYITLAARQVFWNSIRTGDNSLGWSNIENLGWLLKHQREVNRFAEYCKCVEGLTIQDVPLEIINHECTVYDPDVSIGSSFILSETVRKLFQWITYE